MIDFIKYLFSNDFMPHGHCYFWRPDILWTHVIGDGLTALAYFALPFLLFRFVRKRKDIKYRFIIGISAAFILSCGIVHVLAIVSVWHPLYMLEGILKVITAIISLTTVIILIKYFNTFVSVPSVSQLQQSNLELQDAVKKAEEAISDLAQSERKFRSAMQYAPIGKALVGLDGAWLEMNKALCAMLEYSEEELRRTNFQNLTHKDDLELDLDYMHRTINGEIQSYQMEKRYITKSGKIVWGILGVSLIRKKNGEPNYFISQIVNITERKKAQEKLAELNSELEKKIEERTAELRTKTEMLEHRSQQLEATNNELESFSYSVSHDLKAPLRALDGFSRALVEKYGDSFDDEAKRWLHFIRDNSVRMDTLIGDLLNFSRTSRETVKKVADVNMNDLVSRVYNNLTHLLNNRIVEFKRSELYPVSCDPRMMEVVWANLIGNAIKYTEKRQRAEIEISSEREGDFVIYTIKDNGAGFDNKYAESIFNVFKRVHSADEFEGTGLGLAIVQRIVSKHDGTISASGEVNSGATFVIKLPL